jgi:hypothetical protein
MSLERLREEFLVDSDLGEKRLEVLVRKILPYCLVSKDGFVELKAANLSGKEQVKLVLAARLIASKLDKAVRGDLTAEELSEQTGLPKNQAAARAKECFDEKFAERSARGSYRARQHRIDAFLDGLSRDTEKKEGA